MHAAPEKPLHPFALRGTVRPWAPVLRILTVLAFVFGAAGACAQLQRSIINPGFEMPFTGPHAAEFNAAYPGSTSWGMFDQSEVPGWETSAAPTTICPATSNAGVAPYTCNPIELWFNGHTGIFPADGRALAELNALESAKLYQNICLVAGESFAFEFAHRGRLGYDSARFETSGDPIMSVTTGNTGTVGVIDSTVATAVSAVPAPNGWTRYSGHYVHTGPGGLHQLGFIAVSAAGGESQGNLLDDVRIGLKPYIEFVTSTFSVEGNPMAQVPKLRVVGRVVTPTQVAIALGGTAAAGTDYDFGGPSPLGVAASGPAGVTLTVPPGDYGADAGNILLDLPLRVLDDTAIEDNETIVLTLTAPGAGAGYLVANGTACGAPARQAITHTAIDNDVDLRVDYQMSVSGQIGGTASHTVTFSNATAGTLTLAPFTAHDAVSAVAIVLHPQGMILGPWTCTAAGSGVCPTAAGTGAFGAVVGFGPGGTVTFVLASTITSSTTFCGTAITATATISATAATRQPPNGSFPTGLLGEGTAHQGAPGFAPAPNSAEAVLQVQPCAQLSITKANGADSVAAGSTTAYTLTVANAGPSGADNALLRDPPVDGLQCTAVSCTGATGAASCPAAGVTLANLQGSGILLDNFPPNSSISFLLTCGVLATGV